MANIRLAFLLLWITNVSFAQSDPSLTFSPENKKLLNDENGIAALLMRLNVAETESKKLETENKKLGTENKKLETENIKLEATCTKIRCDAVGTNFKCAMDTMKDGLTRFLFSNGVFLLKPKKCEWNPRVFQYRIENDLIWTKPSLMYPENFENGSEIVHQKDNITMCQWIKFVSLDLQKNHFNYPLLLSFVRGYAISIGKAFYPVSAAVCEFRETGLALRNNLNDYYEKLDQAERDTRYPNGKSDLYSYFAGVMVRTYRLACYYAYILQYIIKLHLRQTYENGTIFFLSTAINKSMPTWYIDQEHLDMLNIVQRTQGFTKPKDFFFVSKNFTNGKGEQVVIPGFKNCGSEPVETNDELE